MEKLWNNIPRIPYMTLHIQKYLVGLHFILIVHFIHSTNYK